MTELKRYNTIMIVLHWLLAIFILGALFMGLAVLDEMSNDNPQKVLMLKLHIFVGVGILAFTVLRLAIRIASAQPEPVPSGSPALEKIAKGVHHLLYFLTIFTALSGVALALSANLPSVLLDHVGELPQDYDEFLAHEAHEIFANLLLLTITLHTAAAMYHQFILKDSILSRMSLRKKE